MGEIKITAEVVHGEAEEWVRAAWFGLTLKCLPIVGYSDGFVTGALSGSLISRREPGFSVPQDEALKMLEKHNPQATQYWRDLGFPKRGMSFWFWESEAVIVRGVERQRLVHV